MVRVGWSLAVYNVGIFTASTGGEYTRRFDVLRGADGGSGKGRHQALLDTALLARPHTDQPGRVTVSRTLTFSCGGVIHTIHLLGREGTGSEPPILTFWEDSLFPELKKSVPLTSLSRVLYNSATGVGLYQQGIEAQFSTGDMIGFTQSESGMSSVVLRYIENTGETIAVDESPQSLLMLPLAGFDTSKIKKDNDRTSCNCEVWLQVIVNV